MHTSTTSAVLHILLILLLLTSLSLSSSALPPHRPLSSGATTQPSHDEPMTFFEVTKPPTPSTSTSTPPCSHHILSHDFGNTYSRPPITAPYSPPSHCPFTRFSSIILDFSATCRGRQFDRIFGIWLDGVVLLRSCTAEPTRDGIRWTVRKDITKYSASLLSHRNHTVSVYIGNLVDHTYTGVYHVNLTFHYYPWDSSSKSDWADLVLPISRNLPLNDGLWFEIQNSTDFQSKQAVIPRNVYRAVLEVCVSYHENDEFWYTNLPNDYLVANNLSGAQPGNGAFREVLVSVDGDLVGAISPFTVIFTGGINPLLWRPISAIGSFDLPTYDIELTPFLGNLLDGKPHTFQFSVTNALNVWYVDANLHLWLDDKLQVLEGQLLENNAHPLTLSSKSRFKGLDGNFFTAATRSLVSKGWLLSSKGNITTISTQEFDFANSIALQNHASSQTVNQTIHLNTTVSANPFHYVLSSHKTFPLFLYTNQVDHPDDGTYSLLSNVTLGFHEDNTLAAENQNQVSSSTLRNHQKGEGSMVVKNNLVVSGLGTTHQVYKYHDNYSYSSGLCYFRNVSSYNYTIIYDQVTDKCQSKAPHSSPNHRMLLL